MTESASGECRFCEIINGNLPKSLITETPNVVVFTSLDGGYPLIVPRLHVTDWLDPRLTDEVAAEIGILQKKLANAVNNALRPDGITIFCANGRASGQEIFHMHVHIIPRFSGDNIMTVKRSLSLDRAIMDEKAGKIKDILDQFRSLS